VESEKRLHQKWCLLKATMDERGRRLWPGAEADAIGWGGVAAAARATGLAISTVRKGRDEARAARTARMSSRFVALVARIAFMMRSRLDASAVGKRDLK